MSQPLAHGWSEQLRAEFLDIVGPLSNWGRWGDDDERGTLNLLTAAATLASAALVRDGRCVPLGRAITNRPAPDNPRPVLHLMSASGDAAAPRGGSHASDWIGIGYHGFAVTHIDALSHQFFDAQLYNGRPAALVSTRSGAGAGSVESMAAGCVGRGVLLDLPRASGRAWLELGEAVEPGDLDRAARGQGLECAAGDLVLVRTGRDARAAVHGPVDPLTAGGAGLSVRCLPWLRAHDVAVLGSDAQSDVMVPNGAPHAMPIHAGALTFLGLPLLDNVWLEELAAACAQAGRWEFQLVVAPLALHRATGSPVNPLALL